MTDPATQRAVRRTEDLLGRRAGLRLDAVMQRRLGLVLAQLATTRGVGPEVLAAGLEEDPGAFEAVLDAVTVQESSFFRDERQLGALAEVVLPIVGDPVVIWSAGCANGQEPWTLAMLLAEQGRAGTVVASDLSPAARQRTAAGIYPDRGLRGLSPARRDRFLQRHPEGWEVRPELRGRVSVVAHNLTDPPPPEAAAAQVVLCRNVLIYFTPEQLQAVLQRMERHLRPDGWLLLGFSESLWQLSTLFTLTPIGDSYAYRPAREPSAAPPSIVSSQECPPPRPTPEPVLPEPARPEPARPDAAPPDAPDELAAAEAALGRGDTAEAIRLARRVTFGDPDGPLGHLVLARALDAAGDPHAARRAWTSCRESVQACRRTSEVGGFRIDTLLGLVTERLNRKDRP